MSDCGSSHADEIPALLHRHYGVIRIPHAPGGDEWQVVGTGLPERRGVVNFCAVEVALGLDVPAGNVDEVKVQFPAKVQRIQLILESHAAGLQFG